MSSTTTPSARIAWVFRGRVAATVVACALPVIASTAKSADELVDGWTIKPFVIDGTFDRCNANAPSRDLAIVLFKDGRLSALVADPAGAYHEAQIDVDVDVGGKVTRQVPAVVIADQLFLVTLGKGQAPLDRLAKAPTLRITTIAKTYTFDITKLPKALLALQKCAAHNAKANP